MNMFDFLKHIIESQDGQILFVLGLIAIAMIIDFFTGTLGAYINKDIEFKSKNGINGILRKIASITLMIFFIPMSVLLPDDTGVILLYVLYIGYLGMELQSILENLAKMGVEVTIFAKFVEMIKKLGK